MDTLFNALRKGLVFSVLLAFAFVFTYVPQPIVSNQNVEVAHALLPVTDPIAVALSTAQFAADAGLIAKETLLDSIAYAIAKAMISSLVGSLITWINSGFEGSPAFVQDLRRTLTEIADRTAGEFIKSLGDVGSFICSPFQLDIQIALSLEYQTLRDEDKPYEGCTLTGIVNNIEDFYAGSIAGSGWEDWIDITSQPELYTPYGAMLTARSALSAKLANEEGQVLTEVNWGGGFLSGKICEAIEGPGGTKESCVISKPGKTIADSLNKALGAGQDQLVAADEINELIGALIGALANQALTGAAGLLGLTPGTGHTYAGFDGGSYVSAATAEASQLATDINNDSGVTAQTYEKSIEIQENLIDVANKNIALLNTYIKNVKNPEAKREAAIAASEDAIKTRDKALSLIPSISKILTEHKALDVEGKDPETTDERRQAIAQRKAQLSLSFTRLSAFTTEQARAQEALWASAIQ